MVGVLSVLTAVAVWALVPHPPPAKGLGPSEPGPEMYLAFFAGTFLVAGTVRSATEAWRTRRWPVVSGVVKEVRAIERPYVYLAGEYTVGGRSYVLQDVRPGVTSQYRVGEALALRYDPASPGTAALQPLVSRRTAATLVAGAVLLVGSGLALVAPTLA